MMLKNALALYALSYMLSMPVLALEPMAEEELSASSAQDGLSLVVALPTNGWRATEMSLTDRGGITTVAGYNNDGTILAKNVGFNLCTNGVGAACNSATARTLNFDFDMVGNVDGGVGNKPMLNIAVSLANGASKVRLFIDDIRLRNGQSGATEFVLVDFLQNYIDIVPIGSSTLFAVQLGNEPLGHMIHFTNGNFGTIDFGTIAFVDRVTPTSSVNFGFKLDNVNLTGTGFDANPAGLIYTASNFGNGTMNATFSDVRMGGVAAASMGSFGVQGISVNNLTVAVSGKL